jgi:RNA polymerase primary sigma factor
MDNKIKFQEMLLDILEVARVQGNILAMDEIKKLFGDMELSEAQYEHIFAYLAANHIKVSGYVERADEYSIKLQQDYKVKDEVDETEDNTEVLNSTEDEIENKHSQEDSAYLKMYLEDLEAIKPGSLEEESSLIDKIKNGDVIAKNRLIEMNLRYVVEVAGNYKNQGLTLEDLIQEGNIGLMSSMEQLDELSSKENFREFIKGYVNRFIENALQEQKDSINFEKRMLQRMKYLNDAANELAEDLGREANIHELSEYTKIPVNEIIDALNISVDSIKVENHHNHEKH